jgi:hypothetical protein
MRLRRLITQLATEIVCVGLFYPTKRDREHHVAFSACHSMLPMVHRPSSLLPPRAEKGRRAARRTGAADAVTVLVVPAKDLRA